MADASGVPTYDLGDLPDAVAERCIFWGDPDADEYHHEHIDNAIADAIDEHAKLPAGPHDRVEVVGVVRTKMHIGTLRAGCIVDDIIERLDEDHGGENDMDYPRERMLAAAQALIDAVEVDYVPWTCDVACVVSVPVLAWARENAPQWLEEVNRGHR